ncbi:hypothetical protein ABOM_000207 [Aspergillus bombycis]|uniref:NmrA-like domain-containing protein n=1 Tax=Aspergillus bombycis TaxID=109264 RepID=A0A1F8AHG7_9EURO|nr:hypothetical protein ABOM_000207 [Aspergillus bombycis]OGM51200.1 hypothetical protein ABOM_000207 [Aspergillus bombycis]
MVRVVVAGGTGPVAQEVVAALVDSGKHEVVTFTRSDVPKHARPSVKFVVVDYDNKTNLAKNLEAVHSVLCFISSFDVQIRLIDACIEAGVKRFAPNEWAARSNSGIFTFKEKDRVYEYLQEVNRKNKRLEYCLFQPGNFMNYLSSPIPSTTYTPIFTNQWGINNRRAIIPAGEDYRVTLTTVQDMAKVVTEALGYQDTWPEIGGITGSFISNSELIKLVESIRGPFKTETVSRENLEAGRLKTSWIPMLPRHPDMQVDSNWGIFSEYVIAELILGGLKGAWEVSNEWNQLLPHLKLTPVGGFLSKVWKDEP